MSELKLKLYNFFQIMASGTDEALKSAGVVLSGDDFIFTFLVKLLLFTL